MMNQKQIEIFLNSIALALEGCDSEPAVHEAMLQLSTAFQVDFTGGDGLDIWNPLELDKLVTMVRRGE